MTRLLEHVLAQGLQAQTQGTGQAAPDKRTTDRQADRARTTWGGMLALRMPRRRASVTPELYRGPRNLDRP